MVQTNEVKMGKLAFVANPLVHQTAGVTAYIQYQVVTDGASVTVQDSSSSSTSLIEESVNGIGQRVLSKVFSVSAASAASAGASTTVFGMEDAPVGTYKATIVVTYTAS